MARSAATMSCWRRPRHLRPPPAPVASTDTSASRDYEFSERVGTVEAWDLYIAAHPSGFYTDLARVQRNKLAAARPAPAPATVAIETKKVQTTPVAAAAA